MSNILHPGPTNDKRPSPSVCGSAEPSPDTFHVMIPIINFLSLHSGQFLVFLLHIRASSIATLVWECPSTVDDDKRTVRDDGLDPAGRNSAILHADN